MKPTVIVIFSWIMFSCSRNLVIQKQHVVSVHPVYNDSISSKYNGYNFGTEHISYDKNNISVKEYLARNITKIDSLNKAGDVGRITDKIYNSKSQKYLPIKVVPLDEFGYIRLQGGKVIFYGVMRGTFIDLTNNRVYYK